MKLFPLLIVRSLLATAAILIAGSPAANAQTIISIDFGAVADNVVSPTASAGVVAATNWNTSFPAGFGGLPDNNITNINDNLGDPTTADYSFSNFSGTSAAGSAMSGSDGTMLNGQLFNNNWGQIFLPALTVSEIPFALYDVYIYANANVTGRSAEYQIGSNVQILSNATNPTTFVEGDNYVKFSSLSGSSFNLDARATIDIGGGIEQVVLSGVQIVAVPEPSVVFMGALGLIALIVFRRRTRQ